MLVLALMVLLNDGSDDAGAEAGLALVLVFHVRAKLQYTVPEALFHEVSAGVSGIGVLMRPSFHVLAGFREMQPRRTLVCCRTVISSTTSPKEKS